MSPRRTALIAAIALLFAPVFVRAEGQGERRTRVELNSYLGRTSYTSCDNRYTLRYGGLAAGVGSDEATGFDYRLAAGYGAQHRAPQSGEDLSSADPPEDLHSTGVLGQLGYGWDYFGFRLGLGVGLLEGSADLEGVPLVPVTLRLGRWDGLHLRAGFLDEVPLERGVLWGELGLGFADRHRLTVGLRGHLWSDAAMLTAGFEIRPEAALALGLNLGLALDGRPNGQGQLTLAWAFGI